MYKNRWQADYIGAVASLLCLLHCLATPFLFLVKTCASSCCVNAPVWWQLIDYVFLAISGVAIYHATQYSTKKWIGFSLWGTWAILFFALLNEKWLFIPLPPRFSYIPALIIVALHLYNRRCCQVCNRGACK